MNSPLEGTKPMSGRVRRACAALAAAFFAAHGAAAAAPERGPFRPSAALDLAALTRLVVERTAELQQDRLALDLARAEAEQSRLYENPTLDATWGTIPIGETNPPGLSSPFARVPNYNVGLSYRVLIGKRGPRQDRADALARGARASLEAGGRERALELAHALGTAATMALRLEGLRGQVEQGERSLAVARARVAAGGGTPLDVDRLALENGRAGQQLLAAEADRDRALAACAGLLHERCAGFGGRDDALAFLTAWLGRAASARGSPEARPDVRALAHYEQAAAAELRFAEAQAIPDPTFRVGYVHDRFVLSGAQMNSLNVGVSLPLPFFDHGQALAYAARARAERLSAQRERIVASAHARVESLRSALETQRRRLGLLEADLLPRSRGVVSDLERATETRLLPTTDLIQARHALNDLLIEEADAYGDAFELSLDLLAQFATPPAADRDEPPPPPTAPR
jgi:outer membrane protein, heavy metal efflux system